MDNLHYVIVYNESDKYIGFLKKASVYSGEVSVTDIRGAAKAFGDIERAQSEANLVSFLTNKKYRGQVV